MKRFLAVITAVVIMAWSLSCFGAGSCVQTGSTERIQVTGGLERRYVTLTCTGDGTITAYSFDPAVFGVRGWYLYNVTTDPGASAPTAAYDITLVAAGEDVAGGKLADRSATATETVLIAPSTQGYHMTDAAFAITFANQTANPSTIVLKLRFTNN